CSECTTSSTTRQPAGSSSRGPRPRRAADSREVLSVDVGCVGPGALSAAGSWHHAHPSWEAGMLKQSSVGAIILLSCAWPASGEQHGSKKPSSGATRPGPSARQRASDEKGAVTEYTYQRLEDVAGERVIEDSYQIVSGQYQGTNLLTGCLVPAS